MSGRRVAFVAVIALLTGSVCGIASSAPQPALSDASPSPCASVLPDLPNDLPTAFAYDLESPAILHFLSSLAAVPERDQKRVFDAAVTAASSPAEHELETAIAATCANLDEVYGTSRASYLVVNEWKLGELSDAKRFGAFSEVVATAVAALSHADRLSPAERRSAMLPFATVAAPTPSSLASGSIGCLRSDESAHALHLVEPSYPPLARSAATAGTVRIEISLSDTGDVRSARIFNETLGRGLGAQDIIRASIFAAAASTYAPQIQHCVAVAGFYLFTVEYRRR